MKSRCRQCLGLKVIQEKKELDVVIEKGMHNGQRIIRYGEADQEPGVEPGDIIIIIMERGHSVFSRFKDDLYWKVEVTLKEALCGFNREVPHPDGRLLHIECSIGKVARPGEVKVVIGGGMPRFGTAEKGNLHITITVKFPDDFWATVEHLKNLEALLPGTTTSLPVAPGISKDDMTNGAQPSSSRESRNPGMEVHLVDTPLDEGPNQDTAT